MIFERNRLLGLGKASDLLLLKFLFRISEKEMVAFEEKGSQFNFSLVRVGLILFFFFFAFFAFPALLKLSQRDVLFFFFTISILLTTGISTFFTNDQLKSADNRILRYSSKVIQFCKFSILDRLLLSAKSTKEIKYRYIFLGSIQMFVLSIFLLLYFFNSDYYGPNSSHEIGIIENIYLLPSNILFVSSSKGFGLLLTGWIVYFIMIPTSSLRKEVANRNNLKSIYYFTFLVIMVLTISKVVSYSYGLDKSLNINTLINKFQDLDGPETTFFLLLMYSYLQCLIVLPLHMINTLWAISGKNLRGYWLFEILLLLPYFIFTFLFIWFVPVFCVLFFSWILNVIFKISKALFKLPSVISVIGFAISLALALYSYYKGV